jgi:hypothetical protein
MTRCALLLSAFLISFCLIIPFQSAYSQCCGVGGGSPLATDISQSVLLKNQFELNINSQYINSRKFLDGSEPADDFLSKYSSQYNYFRVAYGVTDVFTMSVETGYWGHKMQIGLHQSDTMRSSGIGDLVLFPKLNIFKNRLNELTVGIGLKIPVGKYSDSAGLYEPFSGQTIYLMMPPAVQPSSGSNDFIYNVFYARSLPEKRLRFFVNAIYIMSGWNPKGEHFGDYASLGLFAGYSFTRNVRGLLQLKGEWIDRMEINQVIRKFTFPTYDPEATGSKKIFVAPQINVSTGKGFNLYLMSEVPVYQFVNKTQIASQLKVAGGVSYRFKVSESRGGAEANDNCEKP